MKKTEAYLSQSKYAGKEVLLVAEYKEAQ